MQTITTIGFDIAKSIFQVHCVDAEGKVILRRLAAAVNCGWITVRQARRPMDSFCRN